jgi:large subunit ribosomal protein L9
MQVILLETIKGLGNKYDVKNVKNGYARNFLLPKGLVKIATDKSLKELEARKTAWEKEEQEIKSKLETLAKNLSSQEFKFEVKTGKKGEVFGSVGKSDIKTRIYTDVNTDLHEYLQDFEIELEKPIKTLGEHQAQIILGRGVKTKIKIIVEPFDAIQGKSSQP